MTTPEITRAATALAGYMIGASEISEAERALRYMTPRARRRAVEAARLMIYRLVQERIRGKRKVRSKRRRKAKP